MAKPKLSSIALAYMALYQLNNEFHKAEESDRRLVKKFLNDVKKDYKLKSVTEAFNLVIAVQRVAFEDYSEI